MVLLAEDLISHLPDLYRREYDGRLADHTAAAPADLSIDALETMFQKGRILNRMEHTSDARNSALFSILDTPIVKLASTSFHICEFDVIQWTNRTDHWKLSIWPNHPLLAEPIKTV